LETVLAQALIKVTIREATNNAAAVLVILSKKFIRVILIRL